MTSPPTKQEGAFRKLVRSLSRSSPRIRPEDEDGSKRSNGAQAISQTMSNHSRSRSGQAKTPDGILASGGSPTPDSYFPQPPRETLRDREASGRDRHPDSRGARALELGSSSFTGGQAAPGVSFAPTGGDRVVHRSSSELNEWTPLPRRTQSQRHKKESPATSFRAGDGQTSNVLSRNGGGGRGGGRDRSISAAASMGSRDGAAAAAATAVNGSASHDDRRGVTLEDKPLSRNTSVKRAASAAKRTVERISFVQNEKPVGEKRVLILVADGSEEIEVMTPFDVFVRASLSPVIVSVSPQFSPSQSLPYITLSRGAKILADTQFETLRQEYKDDFDAVIIPGGAKGAERLSQDKDVQRLIRSFHRSGKLVGMICAGSLAAKASGIAQGERLTSHPSVKGDLEKHFQYVEDRVVVSKNLVTSRGPGTALEFSLRVVEMMAGRAKREEVEGPMML